MRTILRKKTNWALSEDLGKIPEPGPHTERLPLTLRGPLSTSAVPTEPLRNQPQTLKAGLRQSDPSGQGTIKVCRDQPQSLIC